MTGKRRIYTVSELTRKIKLLLEEGFAQIWIEGEISNFTHHQSGHMYFSLKDENSIISSVLFRGVNRNLKFELKDGIQVICFGKVSLYDRRGQYQLYVEKIEPKGVGALQLAFEQLKERLSKEGLFDPRHKKPIPFLPQRIGIVTSPTGAAISDILTVLKEKFANLEIVLRPVRVQGEGSAEEIAEAIDQFNQYDQVDVLIVGRGGGSLEDLWAFNEEVVARAIYRSRIPIISAVGHEINSTISDGVADQRAATPSKAAERVIADKQELLDKIDNFYSRAEKAISYTIELLEHRLQRYVFRKDPSDLIQQYQQRIDELISTLNLKLRHLAEINREKYNVLIGKLHALSPLNILSRGYSITLRLPQRQIVTKAEELKIGAKVSTKLAGGSFISKIEEISKNGRNEI
ncbi:MAG: exodeoxyribonuclease VII large subunit [Omnitrophica bacterium]|nr:exodeoxyribonuclease VII large subunit [Candidatus Omnitrophota bacterium]